jgi:hypothetical protein
MNTGMDFFTVYFEVILFPVVGLIIIELVCRATKIPNWKKLVSQGIMCVGFGVAYLSALVAHWLTGVVLLALAFVLFYQAKISKLHPEKAMY